MPKYKVVWNKGTKYSAEVIADSSEEAWNKAQRLSGDMRILDHFVEKISIDDLSAGKLLKYSFDSRYANCTKDEAVRLLETTEKPIVYTLGLEFRGPGTHRVPMAREEAIKKLKSAAVVDVDEEKDCVHVNEMTGSDMW